MSISTYSSPGWNTHSEIKLREIDFPLFSQGEPSHFTIERSYCGPRETYVPLALSTVDAIYNGIAAAVTGTAADDYLVFAAAKKFLTGDPVLLAVTTGLAGLTDATTYYLIRINDTTFKLATTLALAIAGTGIDITSNGTGTLTPPAAYLVAQSRLRDGSADQVLYERLFASVPAQWSDSESFAFEFPSYIAGTPGTSYSVTGITVGSGTLLLSTTATGISVGDGIQATLKYTRGAIVYQQTIVGKATAVSSGSSVTVAGALLGTVGAPSSVTGNVAKTSVGRTAAETLTVDSRIVHDYALTTMSARNTDLPLFQQFRPLDNLGNTTNDLTVTTLPTSASYATLVLDGTEIVAEASVRRRYLGNIFVRSTRLVPAT